jgi:broad specificity phosphatase PhoE
MLGSNTKQIWLVRHGETAWSKTGQHTGRTDIPLTEAGKRTAVALGEMLAPKKFALVLTSPLSRARETCELAGLGERAQVTPDLLEWDYGVFEGKTTKQIRGERPAWSIWQTDVPNGETIEQVAARATRVIEQAAAADGDVALFAHGHILRILTSCWLSLEPRSAKLFALDTGGVGVLGYEHETRVMRSWNRSS